GIPDWLAALVVVVALIAALNLAVVTLAKPLSDLIGRAPEVGVAIKDKLHVLDQPIAALQDVQAALGFGQPGAKVEVDRSRMIEGLVTGIVTVMTPAAVQFLIQVVLFFGSLFFFIAGRGSLRESIVSWFSERDTRLRTLRILNDVESNLSGYLIVVTAINLSLGVVTAFAAYLMGLPAPLLWGALAFGLNYVPYVGPGIMYVLLFVIGLLTYPTILGALLPPAVFIVLTLIEGQVLTPLIVGRSVLVLNP